MKLKPLLKLAENLFNDGFVCSKASTGAIYNVLTGENQIPSRDVYDVLDFIGKWDEKMKSKVSRN